MMREMMRAKRSCSRAGRGSLGITLMAALVALGNQQVADAQQLPAFVYAERTLSAPMDMAARRSAVDRAESGRLLRRNADGSTTVLVDASQPGAPKNAPVDVLDPEVSFDASKVLFAGFVAAENGWRIFEVNADGSALRQITHSDRELDLARYGEAAPHLESYDDVDPCYLPDGRICFVSTRYPGIAPDHRLRTTNLYIVNADSSDLHRITTERFGADTPAVEPATGRIVYSRWWRTAQTIEPVAGKTPEPIPPGSPGYGDPGTTGGGTLAREVLRGVNESEFPGVNSWFLASIQPDGTGLEMHSGLRLDRQATQAYKPSFLASGRALSLFIPQTPLLGVPGRNGLRIFSKGAGAPASVSGPQVFGAVDNQAKPLPADGGIPHDDRGQPLPVDPAVAGSTGPFFTSAVPLNERQALVSASPDGREYGIFLQPLAPGSALIPVVDAPGVAEMDAVPLSARDVLPVASDQKLPRLSDNIPPTLAEARSQGGTFQFVCENIFANAALDVAIANAPPVGKKLAIEFYMAPQRTGLATADAPILIQSVEVAASGRVEAELPAGVPLFELLRRPDDTIALGRDGQIFHVGGMNFGEANQKASCVGCHAGHSMMKVPEDPTWTNLAPSALVDDHFNLEFAAGDAVVDILPFFGSAAQTLVDRRSDAFAGEWIAPIHQQEYKLDFRWGIALHARELVVYGPAARGDQGRDPNGESFPVPTVKAFRYELKSGDRLVAEGTVAREVVAGGVRVPVSAEVAFDRMTITIQSRDVDLKAGFFQGPVLAEVEVIARAVSGSTPMVNLVRGDSNCDSVVNLADAVTTLAGLFQGGSFCCATAGDANSDGELNVSDPVYLLRFLFTGGENIPSPYPDCGMTPESNLLCGTEMCF